MELGVVRKGDKIVWCWLVLQRRMRQLNAMGMTETKDQREKKEGSRLQTEYGRKEAITCSQVPLVAISCLMI